jgi:thiol-disulfide isomerase/thioredoxin
MRRAILASVLVMLTAISAPARAANPDSGEELLGQPAPAWAFTRWVRGGPMTLEDLRGKVVLLRWFNEGCHYCEATLPALESIRKAHAGDDLVVIGVFHPKPPRPLDDPHILTVAKKLGFSGAIAFDRDWATLDRYWLDGHPERNWTSVSFLVDRDGRIVWVHGGGEYHPSADPRHAACDADFRSLEQEIAAALKKPAHTPGLLP